MAPIEGDSISGQQPPHQIGQTTSAGAQQQVQMVGHESPGKAIRLRFHKQLREPSKELATIVIVGKNIATIDTAYDDMLEDIEIIYACCSGHDGRDNTESLLTQPVNNVPIQCQELEVRDRVCYCFIVIQLYESVTCQTISRYPKTA